MTEPLGVEVEDCLSFHAEMLARFGGLDGVRDPGLLESALSGPKHLFACEEPTLFDLAAAYAHGIVKNHPFLDGNKRSGFMAAALFLELNGFIFEAPEEEAVERTLALAAGAIRASTFSAWLRKWCRRAKRP